MREKFVKKKQQAPNGVTYAKPHQGLIPNSFSLSQEWNFKPISLEFPDQH